jgi:hypothetical protein
MSGTTWTMNVVCENWMLKELDRSISADRFVKERLSLVELGFRRRGEEIATANAQLPERLAKGPPVTVGHTIRLPGDYREGLKAANAALNAEFIQLVDELNTRFRQAGCNLHYHNGHIQLASDVTLTREVERPFWNLLGANQTWANVDTDVKEAIDRRDRGERDPAFCAARALESTIKIISNEKGWTSGRERGAHNYIDNLRSGQPPFLAVWEAEALKQFFSKIRNPLGHGAGASAMPALTAQQTDWAIGVCMLWIRSLVRRM